jgi:hypothetical protein
MIFVFFFYIKLPVEIPHCSKIEQKHSILYQKIRLFVYFFFRVLTHIIKGEVWAIRNTYNSMLFLSSTLCKIYTNIMQFSNLFWDSSVSLNFLVDKAVTY